jgi:hypothetical protein
MNKKCKRLEIEKGIDFYELARKIINEGIKI